MIKQELFMTRPDGAKLIRTYSDTGMMIRQDGTGTLYAEAVDPEEMGRTYTETDVPVEAGSTEDKEDAD